MKKPVAATLLLLSVCLFSGTSCQSEICREEYKVQLKNGQTPHEGRVEVCTRVTSNRLEWRTVCDDGWNKEVAIVACRQLLGFDSQKIVIQKHNYFGAPISQRTMVRLNCTGNEHQLADCTQTIDCIGSYSAGVHCEDVLMTNCQDGDVKLVNGRTHLEGRVEICQNGLWGTVCHDKWDEDDATTVCRQLGVNDSAGPAIPTIRGFFGEGNGTIHLNNVQCRKSDNRLSACPQNPSNATHNCGHHQDAGAVCPGQVGCIDGDVRLVEGRENTEGRVEMCIRGVWGTVCNNNWNNHSATVVCGQLGLGLTGYSKQFGEGSGPILLDNVTCTGNEGQLLECMHRPIGVHNCVHEMDAGVVCQGTNLTPTTRVPKPTVSPKSTVPTQTVAISVGIAVASIVAICMCVILTVVVVKFCKARKHEEKLTANGTNPLRELSNPNYKTTQLNPLCSTTLYSNVEQHGTSFPTNHTQANGKNHLALEDSDYLTGNSMYTEQRQYDTPTRTAGDDYSTLSLHNDYATLEPYIPGVLSNGGTVAMEQEQHSDYSHLQHH